VESLTELSPNTLECLCHATKPIYTPAFGLGLKAI
jgi:hypothetical protein